MSHDVETTDTDTLHDSATIWYGPHACAVCGELIVKASREHGGAEFDPPKHLMRVYLRGSESGQVDIVYPTQWAPHVHKAPGGSPSQRVTITVNGRPYGISTAPVTYQDLIGIAEMDGMPSLTVKAPGQEGRILHPGDAVVPAEGMVVNVAHTDNA